MEIERKFLIQKMPSDLENYKSRLIEQAYLNVKPVVRVRREDETYYMTYKGGGMMAREEYNLPLDADSYAHLLQKAGISFRWLHIPLNWMFSAAYLRVSLWRKSNSQVLKKQKAFRRRIGLVRT